MNILVLSGNFDIGGQGVRIAQAFSGEDGWEVRSMSKDATYLAYPIDLPFRRSHLEELYQKCDVIHVRNDFRLYDAMAGKYGPKPVVIHYHGSKFRADPNRLLRQQRERGAIGIVSTLDLWLLAPEELMWLPAPYSIEMLASYRAATSERPPTSSAVGARSST